MDKLNKRTKLARVDREHGAALTEFAVLSTAMVTLMFAVPMVGDMVDARQTSIQAGRYALWQTTVVPNGGVDPGLLQDRFFAKDDAMISSSTTDTGSHHLWGADRQQLGGIPGEAVIAIDESTITTNAQLHQNDDGMSISSGVGTVIETVGNAIASVSSANWGIGETALTRTQIGVAVESNAWLERTSEGDACGGGFGCLTEQGAILVDGWSARNDNQARKRTQALVPATALEPVGRVVSILGNIPIFKELDGMDDMFGYVDMNPLPEHANRGLQNYVED